MKVMFQEMFKYLQSRQDFPYGVDRQHLHQIAMKLYMYMSSNATTRSKTKTYIIGPRRFWRERLASPVFSPGWNTPKLTSHAAALNSEKIVLMRKLYLSPG